MQIGDKILIVVKGPHGVGLVPAVVERGLRVGNDAEHQGMQILAEDEGLTWTRGHDAATPEACALLVAAALAR